MATIYTRAGKGSALTWTEGDANITNLNTAKIENVVEDTTPQLGGDLDVNGKKIVSASNGNIAIEPNGTGIVTANKNIETTADVKGFQLWSTSSVGNEGGQINLATPATGSSLSGGNVVIDINQNQFRIFEIGGSNRGVYIDIGSAATGVGTNLLSGGGGMTSFTVAGDSGTNQTIENANTLTITGGTGLSSVASATDTLTINLDNTAVTAGSYTFTNITVDAQGRITSASNGTAFNGTVGATTPNTGAFTTLSASSTVSGTGFSTYLASPPAIGGTTAAAGRFTAVTTTNTTASIVSESNGNIAIQPNGTGQTVIKNLEYNENIFSLGTTSGTITPDVANGNVQTITLNGNLTFSAFANPVAGQSITLIVNTNGTGRTLTSTMKFAGGTKTLSTTNTTDIISVFYDGTNYWASLATDFK